MLKMNRYLKEMLITNNVLPELYFKKDLNDKFIERLGHRILDELITNEDFRSNNKASTNNIFMSSDIEHDLKRLIPSELYTFYLLKNVEITNLESLVQMLIIDDFLKINGNVSNQKDENVSIT